MQAIIIAGIIGIGRSTSNTRMRELDKPRNVAVAKSAVIFEIISVNVGVWLRGKGSSAKRIFNEVENVTFIA
jgi:hypothetical protein